MVMNSRTTPCFKSSPGLLGRLKLSSNTTITFKRYTCTLPKALVSARYTVSYRLVELTELLSSLLCSKICTYIREDIPYKYKSLSDS